MYIVQYQGALSYVAKLDGMPSYLYYLVFKYYSETSSTRASSPLDEPVVLMVLSFPYKSIPAYVPQIVFVLRTITMLPICVEEI